MPYKVICYSHSPAKSWGPYENEQDAKDKVASHPGHLIDYYPVASMKAVNVSLKKFFKKIGVWRPIILNDFND